jgi:arylsulfatase A-like enzyme
VPFIAAGPDVSQGVVSDALVGLQDIAPTFAAAAHGEIGQSVQGKDLRKVFSEPGNKVRDIYYSTTATWNLGQSAMVTDGQWKYIYSEANATEELYDQVNDPHELDNAVVNRAFTGKLAEMRTLLRDKADEFSDTSLITDTGFAYKDVDRTAFSQVPVSGMGWRWY